MKFKNTDRLEINEEYINGKLFTYPLDPSYRQKYYLMLICGKWLENIDKSETYHICCRTYISRCCPEIRIKEKLYIIRISSKLKNK